MPDGILLHLRDTYRIETAWAPKWLGDELRQVRAAAWDARLAGLRTSAVTRVSCRYSDSALRPRPPRPGPDPPGPHASFARGIKPARARALSSRFLEDPSRMRWSGA